VGDEQHRPTLGAYRFILAVIVFSAHIAPRPFHFLYTMTHGYIAVLMFFVVSGYLISNALEIFYVGRVREFVINRCLRLYPSYWVVFAVTVSICLAHGQPLAGFNSAAVLSIAGHPLSDLLAAPFTFSVIAMTWSLRCEWSFYIAIAIAYLLAGKTRHKAWGIYLCCFAALACYAYCSATIDLPWAHPCAHIPYFVVGVAISRLMLRRDPLLASLALLCCAFAMAFIAFGHVDNIGGVPMPGPNQRLLTPFELRLGPNPLNLTNFAILLVLFLIGAAVNIGNGYLRAIDNFLGDLSYPLFISHYGVVAVIGYAFAALPDMQRVWLAVNAVLTVAVLLWWTVDRQVVWLRDRVRGAALYPNQPSIAHGGSLILTTK